MRAEWSVTAPALVGSFVTEEEQVGWFLRRALIFAAPFVWRKYKERRRSKGAS
jgi:hypothetical protein